MAGAAATNLSFIFFLVIIVHNYLYVLHLTIIIYCLQENENLQAVKHADIAIALDRYNAYGN